MTLRNRYKKTETTHCRKGSWMSLYSVVKVKNKCEWHPGKSRGADLDRRAVIAGPGETDVKPQIQYSGISMPRMFVKPKRC